MAMANAPSTPSGQQLAAEPSLWGRVLTEREEPLSDEQANRRRVVQLELAVRALEQTKIATAHDAAWRALHQVRHLDCQYADQTKLIRIASDLTADIKYHAQKLELATELEGVAKTLSSGLLGAEDLGALRPKLLRLSTLAAEERESAWRQANRSIVRRRRAAYWVLGIGVLLTIVIPAITLDRPYELSRWAVNTVRYLAMGACGALGGLLSGLLKEDRLNVPSIIHHLEQLSFTLRPFIGFVAAIIAALIASTGAVAGGDIEQGIGPELLLLAVAAGFSERFLIGHIETLADKATPKTDTSTET